GCRAGARCHGQRIHCLLSCAHPRVPARQGLSRLLPGPPRRRTRLGLRDPAIELRVDRDPRRGAAAGHRRAARARDVRDQPRRADGGMDGGGGRPRGHGDAGSVQDPRRGDRAAPDQGARTRGARAPHAAAASARGGRSARGRCPHRTRHPQGHDRAAPPRSVARRRRTTARRIVAHARRLRVTLVVVALLCLTLGFAAGWWYVAPRQKVLAALASRSRALYELAEGDLENVAHELEKVAEAEPGDSTVFLALAALDRRRGRIERAKAIHRTVLASATLPPEHRVAALVGLGRDLLAQGNDRAAVGALVRASSLAPRSVATLESLARALEQAGAWERAA